MLKTLIKITPVSVIELFESFILAKYPRTKWFVTKSTPDALEAISERKVVSVFKNAAQKTPAYQKLLKTYNINYKEINTIKDFNERVPQKNKENYVRRYPIEARCMYEKLPAHGNIDESGGTSGVATNWIHDFEEQNLLFRSLKFEFNYIFDGNTKNFLVISAWSTGPWATGVKFCELMERMALVKNTATDPKDIIKTLKMFGTNKNYLIGGYPPFVKNLIDECSREINWKRYNIDLVTGGEGVTLEWVNHIRKKLRPETKIISSYGASDVDIGIGFESPICFHIRKAVAGNKELQEKLFGKERELPMIFQYNPTVHYIRNITNKEGKPEFEITLLDKKAAIQKIKYNLHDEGKKFAYKELIFIMEGHDKNFLTNFMKKSGSKDILKLPFLCIFGRSDGTLSFDGANVFPDQIETSIIKNKDVAKKTNRFKIQKKYDRDHNVQFHVHIELKNRHKPSVSLKNKYAKIILDELMDVNPDFKESYTKNKKLKPIINVYVFNHPLFRQDNVKAKNSYIIKEK
ncbi:hypothetical protein COV17_01515 [Candidatus Woesearchaeota archaeon CG10_big_fil_rev_8_21_14_0_10_36_11]|nr:MAG: hypothetical protein COV17_01515 [Candidatus Woesearchaeota archaeon CG10_big_fil_rev_8_21_14_0_10_36_11]